ncbi:MAG TPA: hypothetical protein VFU77_04170 [Steroidobacteraceae bacterium]|nr:hypothetical protein [Steroidobacteraceae bacterium]
MNGFVRLTLALALAMPGAAQPQATDAVAVDPDVHRVLIDNDFIRVFDARASRGTRSPMHTHPPFVLISLDSTRFKMSQPDGKTSLFDLNPGDARWVEGAHHGWELIAGELHAIGIEPKSAQKPGAPAPSARRANDSVAADPEAHHVLFENPHVRVFEGRTSHGRSSPMHSHPPSVLVSLEWMRLKLTLPDGKTTIHDFSPGQVLWLDQGGVHSWEALAGGGRVFVIEVKAAPVPAAAGK